MRPRIHHILVGRVVNINSNIVRYFSTHCREMETEKDDHLFHVFENRAELSTEELRFFENLPISANQLSFVLPSRINILRLLLCVGRDDIILVHSGRLSDLFLMLLLTPWLWKRTALICFGGEIKIWHRIAAGRGLRNRVLRLSQQIVVPGLKAVCTLIPGEYSGIRSLFGRADNYQRVFMASSKRVHEGNTNPRMPEANRMVRVLLNQSASIGGRHREALEWLKRFRDQDIRITCPVSFGEEGEAARIIEAGKDCFGEKFSFIKDKRPYDEYSRMLKTEMDILVLNHLGQAGLGHLYMFLCMGKPAYVRSETPTFDFLREIGIEVRATNSIPEMSFEDFARPLTRESAESNIRNFNRCLSTEASVESCRRIVRLMRDGHA